VGRLHFLQMPAGPARIILWVKRELGFWIQGQFLEPPNREIPVVAPGLQPISQNCIRKSLVRDSWIRRTIRAEHKQFEGKGLVGFGRRAFFTFCYA
jgi:hypothetical protein